MVFAISMFPEKKQAIYIYLRKTIFPSHIIDFFFSTIFTKKTRKAFYQKCDLTEYLTESIQTSSLFADIIVLCMSF